MDGLSKLLIFGTVLAALPLSQPSAAVAGPAWDHNDSEMLLIENGKKRRFVYDKPRDALAGAGVKSGTVLFDGEEKTDGRLAGYAKLFRKGCAPIDYFVEGSIDKSKGEVLLQGQVPLYSGEGCKITGYSDSGSASSLRFTRLGGPDERYAGIPEEQEQPRAGYLPPQAVIEEPPLADPVPEDRIETPRPRSLSRLEEEVEPEIETETARDDRYYGERYEEEAEPRSYEYRRRRAERDGRYDDEDAEYYGERFGDYERDEPDYDEEVDEDDDDDRAYYPLRPRWRRY